MLCLVCVVCSTFGNTMLDLSFVRCLSELVAICEVNSWRHHSSILDGPCANCNQIVPVLACRYLTVHLQWTTAHMFDHEFKSCPPICAITSVSQFSPLEQSMRTVYALTVLFPSLFHFMSRIRYKHKCTVFPQKERAVLNIPHTPHSAYDGVRIHCVAPCTHCSHARAHAHTRTHVAMVLCNPASPCSPCPDRSSVAG